LGLQMPYPTARIVCKTMYFLIVEDNKILSDIIQDDLKAQGHAVDTATDGQSGLEMALSFDYNLIILDIMLPRLDGFTVCAKLRLAGNKTPILMLTAQDSYENKVKGLDSGADDYLTKPFSNAELFARIRALMRRFYSVSSALLSIGHISLDTASQKVYARGQEVVLTSKEYSIFEYLLYNRNAVVARSMIEEHVWGGEYGALSNVVDVLISNLRKKLCTTENGVHIKAVRGLGYELTDKI